MRQVITYTSKNSGIYQFIENLKSPKFQEHCIKQYYDFNGLPTSGNKCINIGYTFLIDNPKFIAHFMDAWVQFIQNRLNKLELGSNNYADVFSLRGFSLDEFRLVLSGKMGEDNFSRHEVFDYLFLTDVADREFFIVSNINDETEVLEAYIKAISKAIKQEIWALKFFFTHQVPLYYSIKSIKRGTFLVSQSGAGKSELLKLFFYDLQRRSQKFRNRTLILLEPSGDLALEVLSFSLNKEKYWKRVVYLNPFLRETAQAVFGYDLLGADYNFVINPFQLPENTNDVEINYLTEELADAFFQIVENETTSQMDVLIEACVETLLRQKDSDITHLKQFMNGAENEHLLDLMDKIPNEERRKIAHRIRTDKKLATSLGGVFYRLQKILGNSEFRRLLVGKSTVQISKLINEGKVIIFDVAKSKLGKYASPAFGKLMLSLILGYSKQRQDIPKEKRKETICIVDEFHNYAVNSMKEVMEEARKFSLHMVLSQQRIGQGMDTDMKRSIISNTALKIAGDNDADSIKFMCENMNGLKPRDFGELPKYSFFTYDKTNKKAGIQQVRVPDFLVEQKPPFYLSKSELKKFFLWIANESGYYVRIEKDKVNKDSSSHDDTPKPTMNDAVTYNPKFKD